MNTVGVIILVVVLFLVGGGVGWILYTRWRAQKLGLPPPSWTSFIPFVGNSSSSSYGVQPAPGGVVGWFNDRIRQFRNRNNRTAAGAYEGGSSSSHNTGTGRQGRAGFGPLDPDDAWDARVGAEADIYGPSSYYEEQELGLHQQHGGGGGGGTRVSSEYRGGSGGSYPMNLAATPSAQPEGGRGRTGGGGGRNPFEDDAEPSNLSLRGVSPRPIDTSVTPAKGQQKEPGSAGSSPTERRSVFRENV